MPPKSAPKAAAAPAGKPTAKAAAPAPAAKAAPAAKPAAKAAPAGKPTGKAAPAAKPAAKAAKAPAAKAQKKTGTGHGVYVRDLSFPGMNKETIAEAFSAIGPVQEVRLRNRKTKGKKGGPYVLVFFQQQAHAQKAHDYNQRVFKGNRITVELAKSGPTRARSEYCTSVYVGNLGGGLRLRKVRAKRRAAKAAAKKKNNKAHKLRADRSGSRSKPLIDLFQGFGKIVKARVYNAGHGFVFFDTVEAANKAVKDRDGFSIGTGKNTRKLSVKLSVRTPASLAARAARHAVRAQAAKVIRSKTIARWRAHMKTVHQQLAIRAAAEIARKKIYRV